MGDVEAQNLVFTSSNKDRSQANQLSELHVYLVPKDRWIEKRRLAINQVVDDAVSSGFVRVLPTANLIELRKVINDQLGQEVLPRNYVFLRSVGRNFTQVKPHQEKDMKTENYMPPFVSEPEIYLKEGSYVDELDWLQEDKSNVANTTNEKSENSEEKGRQRNRKLRLAEHVIGGQSAIAEGNSFSESADIEDSYTGSRRTKDSKMNYKVEKRKSTTIKWNSEGNYSHKQRGDEETNYEEMDVKDLLEDNEVEGGVNSTNGFSNVRRTNGVARSQSKNQTNLHNKNGTKNNNKSKLVQNNDGIKVKKKGGTQRVSSEKYKTNIPKKYFNKRENNVTNSLKQTSKDGISTEDSNYYSPKINQSYEYVIQDTNIKLLDADGNKASDNEIGEIIQYIENEERNPEVESGPVEIRKHAMVLDKNDPDNEKQNKYVLRKTVKETREERTEKRGYRGIVNGDMVPLNGVTDKEDGQRTVVSKHRKEWTENESLGKPHDTENDEKEKYNLKSTSEGRSDIHSRRETNQTQRGRLKIEVSVKKLDDTITQTDDVETENKLTETEAANINPNTDGEYGTRKISNDFLEGGSGDGKSYTEKYEDLTKLTNSNLTDGAKPDSDEISFDDRTRTDEGVVDNSTQKETENDANVSENSETFEKVNNDAYGSNFDDKEAIEKYHVKNPSENNAPERNSRTIDFDALEAGRLHYEESVAGGATDRIGEEIKNNIDKDFEKKKSKFSGSSNNLGERYGWAVDGNGKRLYYTQKKLKTKRGKDIRNELLSNSHRAKADEPDWALKTDGHGGTRERPDWTSDREGGLKRSRSEGFGLANLSRTGKSKKGDLKRMYKATSTLELLADDDPLSRSERLQLLLEELKTERRLLDTKRQELLKQVKQLHSKTNKQKDQDRETWRARYLEEKKKTPELEDECTKFRNELERLHRELLSKLKNDFEGGFGSGKNAHPSDKLSLKIMIARLIQEIEDLKRRVESTKIRLGAETKLRTYAEKDVKALREELMNKKIQVTLTKKEEQSFLGPTLRNGHFISAV